MSRTFSMPFTPTTDGTARQQLRSTRTWGAITDTGRMDFRSLMTASTYTAALLDARRGRALEPRAPAQTMVAVALATP